MYGHYNSDDKLIILSISFMCQAKNGKHTLVTTENKNVLVSLVMKASLCAPDINLSVVLVFYGLNDEL